MNIFFLLTCDSLSHSLLWQVGKCTQKSFWIQDVCLKLPNKPHVKKQNKTNEIFALRAETPWNAHEFFFLDLWLLLKPWPPVPDHCSPSPNQLSVIGLRFFFFFPRLSCTLPAHERLRGLPRWPGATTVCHPIAWEAGIRKAVHPTTTCSFPWTFLCLAPSLRSVGSWALMAVGVWMLCAVVTPETDEWKKENQTPKLLAQFVR